MADISLIPSTTLQHFPDLVVMISTMPSLSTLQDIRCSTPHFNCRLATWSQEVHDGCSGAGRSFYSSHNGTFKIILRWSKTSIFYFRLFFSGGNLLRWSFLAVNGLEAKTPETLMAHLSDKLRCKSRISGAEVVGHPLQE